MFKARSPQTLKAAVESMFRIRVTESPPDAQGLRTVWHRGTKGAELVSWVDEQGRMVRQDFFLFEDVFLWERGGKMRTATSRKATDLSMQPSSEDVVVDTEPEARKQRFERAEAAIGDYVGDDKYLSHLRSTIFVEAGAFHAIDDNPVTAAAQRLSPEQLAEIHRTARGGTTPETPPASRLPLVLVGVVVLIAVAVGVAMLMGN